MEKKPIISILDFATAVDNEEWFVWALNSGYRDMLYWKFNWPIYSDNKSLTLRFAILETNIPRFDPDGEFLKLTTYKGISLLQRRLTMEFMMFKNMTEEEESNFQQWARDNYVPFTEIKNFWHPVVRLECARMDVEAWKQHYVDNPEEKED